VADVEARTVAAQRAGADEHRVAERAHAVRVDEIFRAADPARVAAVGGDPSVERLREVADGDSALAAARLHRREAIREVEAEEIDDLLRRAATLHDLDGEPLVDEEHRVGAARRERRGGGEEHDVERPRRELEPALDGEARLRADAQRQEVEGTGTLAELVAQEAESAPARRGERRVGIVGLSCAQQLHELGGVVRC
jgi:hypothetical protein